MSRTSYRRQYHRRQFSQPPTGWRAVCWKVADLPRKLFSPRRFFWGLGVVLAVGLIWLAGSHLGPGLRARDGQGVAAVWIAQQQENGQWYGQFVVPPGKVLLSNVYYAGGLSAVQQGTVVPALDSGASNEVYPLSGSSKWVHDLIGVIVGGLLLIALLARWLIVFRRRRRAARDAWFTYGDG